MTSTSWTATRTITATLGSLLGLSNINHGVFEALQGNNPTTGLILQAIGPDQRFWVHGTEEAFSVVPNFLASGLLSILVGLAVIVWSIGFCHRQNGRLVLLLLFILSFFVGGGIGQVVFFLTTWGFATRMGRPPNIGKLLAGVWRVSLPVLSILFLVALELAIFGFLPGVSDPEIILYTCWSLLLGALVLIVLTYLSGFACDSAEKGR